MHKEIETTVNGMRVYGILRLEYSLVFREYEPKDFFLVSVDNIETTELIPKELRKEIENEVFKQYAESPL